MPESKGCANGTDHGFADPDWLCRILTTRFNFEAYQYANQIETIK